MKHIALSVITAGLAVSGGMFFMFLAEQSPAQTSIASTTAPIKVGILHSKTGPLASVENPIIDASLLAIDEINRAGGLLGRPVEPIVADAESKLTVFYQQAERLITQEKVSVIFGCFTSASRKTVKPVIEKYKMLLIYPTQYEGLEESPYIIYVGAAPNQQTLPGVMWCFNNLGTKFFLVGSDYIYPRIANAIIKDHVKALGGAIVGERYIKVGSTAVESIVQEIIKTKPEVILNNLVGKDNNEAFFKALRQANITPEKIPSMSFVIGEQDFLDLNVANIAGNYATWNYMQSISNSANAAFVKEFKKKYGQNRVIGDIMEAEYTGIHLWAQAVKKYKTFDPPIIKDGMATQSRFAPEGTVYVDSKNRHTWKIVRVGKIRSDGQFSIIWNSLKPVPPVPYPIYRTKAEWDEILNKFYTLWGGKWESA